MSDEELDQEGEGEETPPTPDNFADLVATMTDELPDNLLFLPALAQDLIAAYLDSQFTENSPFSILPIVLGGDYSKTADSFLSIVASTATPTAISRIHPARSVSITVTFHTTRDMPHVVAASLFSSILVYLQVVNLREQLPSYAITEELPISVSSVEDLGESQQVDQDGRRFSKTFSVTLSTTPSATT